MKTDEELMQAVCRGDQSAYQALVREHLKSISHYAYRLLGNQKDTEDITQEVFLKLWVNAEKWQPQKAKLSTWLHRIAHNLCVDYLRKHGNTQIRDDLDNDNNDSQQSSATTAGQQDFEDGSEARAQEQRFRRALAQLPESQRSALMLCHYSGFSNKEAAAIMNVSVKALESAMARAKRTLRKIVNEDNSEEQTDQSAWQESLS